MSSFTDQFQLEAMFRRQFDDRLPIPHDLFKLANEDPIVATYINAWRNGYCSWERALIAIIMAMSDRHQKLMVHATMTMDQTIKPIVITK